MTPIKKKNIRHTLSQITEQHLQQRICKQLHPNVTTRFKIIKTRKNTDETINTAASALSVLEKAYE